MVAEHKLLDACRFAAAANCQVCFSKLFGEGQRQVSQGEVAVKSAQLNQMGALQTRLSLSPEYTAPILHISILLPISTSIWQVQILH